MFISKFHIKNFRGINEATFSFNSGLNLIIGENNSGKTAAIDALRLSLGLGAMRKELYVSSDDFFVDPGGAKSNLIEFDLTLSDVNEDEKGAFYEMLSLGTAQTEAQLHMRYELTDKNGTDRIRFRYWAGDNEGQAIPSEALELLYYVHLGALRDAERDLTPSRGNRLSQLFLKLVKDRSEQEKLVDEIEDKILENESWENLITKAVDKVNEHLSKIVLDGSQEDVDIDFIPLEFKRVVEGLKMLVLSEGDRAWEIDQNGLGMNNLIYIATVLGDILEKKENEKESFIALLVEEPEAHIHPQLQDTLFNFLRATSQGIQIFVTSHSPTIASKAALDSITVMNAQLGTPRRPATCPLTDEEKRYLERFLDVTKAQLFFARGVVLVEGISEAMLFPIMARSIGVDLDKKGIEVVNISGTAFSPFAHLFNAATDDHRLDVPCSVVTDDDKDDQGNLSPRAIKAMQLLGGMLKVFLADRTFEYELYQCGNADLIKATYAEMHPNTEIGSAIDLVAKLRQNRDKGEFSQLLAHKCAEAPASLKVPAYIESAVRWAVERK